eukprot:1030309-Pleurochrysis_carterae.AAC.1
MCQYIKGRSRACPHLATPFRVAPRGPGRRCSAIGVLVCVCPPLRRVSSVCRATRTLWRGLPARVHNAARCASRFVLVTACGGCAGRRAHAGVDAPRAPVSYTHLTLPTILLV